MLKAAAQTLLEKEKHLHALTATTPLLIDGVNTTSEALIIPDIHADEGMVGVNITSEDVIMREINAETEMRMDADSSMRTSSIHTSSSRGQEEERGGVLETKSTDAQSLASSTHMDKVSASQDALVTDSQGDATALTSIHTDKRDGSPAGDALVVVKDRSTPPSDLVNVTQGWMGAVGTQEGEIAGRVCYFDWSNNSAGDAGLNAQV